jgi:hypothetical protein
MHDNIRVVCFSGPIELFADQWHLYLKYTICTFTANMRVLITIVMVPPFLYRYLLICHDKEISLGQIFYIYFVSTLDRWIYTSIVMYLNIKYDNWTVNVYGGNCIIPITTNIIKLKEYSHVRI